MPAKAMINTDVNKEQPVLIALCHSTRSYSTQQSLPTTLESRNRKSHSRRSAPPEYVYRLLSMKVMGIEEKQTPGTVHQPSGKYAQRYRGYE